MLGCDAEEVLLLELNVEPEEGEAVDRVEILVTELDDMKVELLRYIR